MNVVLYTYIFELLSMVLADVSLRNGHLKMHQADFTTHHIDHLSLKAQPKYCSDPHCDSCIQDDVNPDTVRCTKCSPGFGLKHEVKECDDLINCQNLCVPCEVNGCAQCSTLAASCATCEKKLTLKDGKCTEGEKGWNWMPAVSSTQAKSEKRSDKKAVKEENWDISAMKNPVLPFQSYGVVTVAISAVLYLVLVLGIAFGYMQFKGRRLETVSGYLPEDGFSDAICECGQSWSICIWACFCPCIRWSDTVSQMHFLSFYISVLMWCALMLSNILLAGLGSLLVVFVGAWHRGKIRAHFGLPRDCRTGFQDVIAWLCCQPCAIAQEARHVERALGLRTSSQR